MICNPRNKLQWRPGDKAEIQTEPFEKANKITPQQAEAQLLMLGFKHVEDYYAQSVKRWSKSVKNERGFNSLLMVDRANTMSMPWVYKWMCSYDGICVVTFRNPKKAANWAFEHVYKTL